LNISETRISWWYCKTNLCGWYPRNTLF